jgi:hypothetical protein
MTPTNWLLLVLTLPTANASGRMRYWRAFKALGCGSLRDGDDRLLAEMSPVLDSLYEFYTTAASGEKAR